MFRLYIVIAIFLAISANAEIKTGVIAGKVVDESGSLGVPGTNIQVMETSQGVSVINFEGNYIIPNIAPGIYTIRISSIAYETQIFDSVLVIAEDTTIISVVLKGANLHGGCGYERLPDSLDLKMRSKDLKNNEPYKVKRISGEELRRRPGMRLLSVQGVTQKGVRSKSSDGPPPLDPRFRVVDSDFRKKK